MFVLFSSIAATDPCDIVPVLADPADITSSRKPVSWAFILVNDGFRTPPGRFRTSLGLICTGQELWDG